MRIPTLVLFILGLLAAVLAPGLAVAQDSERLQVYVGNWSGAGALVGGENPEPFRCRLVVTRAAATKINYSGRCSLVNMNLSVAGTIAFDPAVGEYQAVMSSNAGFTGDAVGRQRGDRIEFELEKRQADRGGNDIEIGARIDLIGDKITVYFQVEFNNSGDILTAEVPFDRA